MKISDSKDYVRPKETQQDLISKNPEELNKKLKGFIQIYPEHYKDIECGIWIKYITPENKYRGGGTLIINHAPEYFILKSPYNNLTWPVSLEKNYIFMKGNEDTMERTLVKNNLYKLYEAGLIKIIEEELIEDTTTSKNGLD